MLTLVKLREPCYQKVCFLKLNVCVYLRTKFQVSGKILTSFWQGGVGVILPPPTPKQIPKKHAQIMVNITLAGTNIH